MPGSSTTPGRPGTRDSAPVRVVFRDLKRVDTQRYTYFAAQWLACALPCRRFALILADEDARLGAEAGRYAFLVMDLHHLLPAGLSRRTQIKCRLLQIRRNVLDSSCTDNRKFGLQAIQRWPSRATPPPGTRQWTCG